MMFKEDLPSFLNFFPPIQAVMIGFEDLLARSMIAVANSFGWGVSVRCK